MKWRRYYGKGRDFSSIACVKKTGKFRQEKLLFLQFMQCRLYNDCFFRFSYSASIHFKPMLQNYGKTAFFISRALGWNGSNTFQTKLTRTKHGCFFFKNRQEQLCSRKSSAVVVIKLSNKFFSFFQIYFIYTSDSTLHFWNSKQVSELVETVVQRCSVKGYS